MKTQFGIKLVVAGTRQLITVTLKATSRQAAKEYVLGYYGYCSYLTITEL